LRLTDPEGSLPCSQEPFTCHYHERDESRPHLPTSCLFFCLVRSGL